MKPAVVSSWNPELLRRAVIDAGRKLEPRALWRNPVIFVTALGALAVTIVGVGDLVAGRLTGFTAQIIAWLWFTVLFANFAEAIAEGRGKAQADALKRTRSLTTTSPLRRSVAATDSSAPSRSRRACVRERVRLSASA